MENSGESQAENTKATNFKDFIKGKVMDKKCAKREIHAQVYK